MKAKLIIDGKELETEDREEVAAFREPHVLYRDKNGVIEEEKECEPDA